MTESVDLPALKLHQADIGKQLEFKHNHTFQAGSPGCAKRGA